MQHVGEPGSPWEEIVGSAVKQAEHAITSGWHLADVRYDSWARWAVIFVCRELSPEALKRHLGRGVHNPSHYLPAFDRFEEEVEVRLAARLLARVKDGVQE